MQDRNGEPEPGAESGPAGSSPAGQGEDQARSEEHTSELQSPA